jgi:CBS-domain-containing membrane protein
MENYVSHDPNDPVVLSEDQGETTQTEEINFDKDIDEIIKEIENDPDLQIDEDEIQQMLREIEEETASEEIEKPVIKIDES